MPSSAAQNWCVRKDLNLVSKYQSENFSRAPKRLTKEDLKQSRNMAVVKRELKASNNVGSDSYKGLIIIDALQRLGIDYHFKDEIEQVLQRQYMANSPPFLKNKDLYFASLCFRLLRQQHFYVPADAFDKFMNKERKLEKRLIRGESTEALMSLYEASQLRIKGEDVLDEAESFSCQLLEERIKFLNHHEAQTVRNTIAHPCHRSFARFTKNNFIKDAIYGKAGFGKALQELAYLDTAFMQAIHRRELNEFSRWWNDLRLAHELKMARSQPLKWFTWSMAMLTDPSLSEERIELTKAISLIYVIDDIFDVYGTIDDLTLFTKAVNRWDIAAIEQLPDYMKKCFRTLHEMTNEIGYKVYNKHGFNPVDYLAKAWARLCTAFLEEAKWFASGHLPGADEYLTTGIASSGVHVALVHMFFLIGDGSTKEQAQIVRFDTCLISYHVAALLRLWDDLGSAKDENQDGKDGSYIACYMKEHEEASVENGREQVSKMISETWKCLNKECLFSRQYSETFIRGSLNLARMVPLMYTYDDSQSLPLLEEYTYKQLL
ncbi:Terpene synthase 3 [Heracleum sosnowskyi]|uniref:Terpene synthase 3 n=1 Tax=Heracleum sosnowskyi TaxID=360622 RepID=A0AAD8MAH2_9APIA|nr:Terpene synthase 3 [Heracleum sosnowskyi]